MSGRSRVLAVIPARGGSKGLPGKNIRLFAGLPLIAHSILLARLCPEIDRLVVSTDSPEIASVARDYGVEVPNLRPSELAQDDTPLWPVLRQALASIEEAERARYEMVLLLDPTSPARLPEDVAGAMEHLVNEPSADGVVGVSRPDFNPIWHCVVASNGWMTDLIAEGAGYDRRQDVPPVYRINGSLYLWRTAFMRDNKDEWRRKGKHLIYEIPEIRAMSIDSVRQFEQAELLVKHGMIVLPWLNGITAERCAP